MDMSNATAAGPSRGLLDILFGGKPKEAEGADGQEFMPLMELIKAMKNKDQEDETGGRTQEETAAGKGMVDHRVVGMPVWFQNLQMTEQSLSTAENVDGGKLAALMANAAEQKPQASLEKVDTSQVNRILSEKSLPSLTPEEAKLLQAVNDRIELAAREVKLGGKKSSADLLALLQASGLKGPESEAAPENAKHMALNQELIRKGIDPNLLRGQENPEAGATPEKFLSTEAYMHMHEHFTKGQPKEESAAVKRLGAEEGISLVQAREARALNEVTEAGKKSDDLFGKADRKPGDLLKQDGAGSKLDPSVLSFESSLLQSMKSEASAREVMLPGTKPEEMRDVLLGEVNQGVSLQALKGGGEMRLVINPPELGEVKLQIGAKDGKVDVQVIAQNEEVAKVIRSGSRDLESTLRDQNLSLTKFEVSVSADSPLLATDTKSNLADQFMQQNPQNSFMQSGANENGGFSRWDGSQQDRGEPGAGPFADQQGSGRTKDSSSSSKTPVRDGSRRLDVVA